MAHLSRISRAALFFLLAAFFILGCSQPMPLHATYVPANWHCDDELRTVDDPDLERLEAASPNIGDDWYEGLLEVEEDDLFVPVSLKELYGPTDAILARNPPIIGQSSPGLAFVVYQEDEGEAATPTPRQNRAPQSPPSGVVNINEATAAQLTLLPGIGPSLAERIVEYRQNRRFAQPQHLRRVKGIGQAKYNRIKDHVVVEGESTMR